MTPETAEPDTALERILVVATRLFASLGYDGTSTRLIADAVGLNVATVAYHAGGKRDLYLLVMERAHQAEHGALSAALTEFTPDPAGLHRLLDRYLDFCVARPEVPALWVHRWLSDASDLTQLEGMYAKPLVDTVGRAIELAMKEMDHDPQTDLEFTLWSFVWCIHGFGLGGTLDEQGRRLGGQDAPSLTRFRAHLHQLADRLLVLR
ncbi:MAG: TetR family transcriptional regulator [Streptosporangiaceae bacterium]